MVAEAAFNTTINITAQPPVALTDEACTDSGDHITYSITNSAKRYLDLNTAVVVQKSTDGGSTWNTVTNYTLKHAGGIIIFASANGPTNLIRIHSGSYYVYSAMLQGHTADVAAKVQGLDVTSFNSAGTESYIGGLLSAQIKLDRWWLDNVRAASLTARDLVVVDVTTPSGRRYEGYQLATDLGIKSDVKAAVGEALTFQVTQEFFAN